MNDARRRGLTRHIGVSNFTTRLLAEAWAAIEEPLAVLQCEYHPHLNQDKLLAACRARGMAFVAYSPLGQGDALSEPAICKIADRLSRTPAQVVLRWLIQQPSVVAIPKSANRRRIADNRRVYDFSLPESDMAAIRALATNDGRIVREPTLAPDWD